MKATREMHTLIDKVRVVMNLHVFFIEASKLNHSGSAWTTAALTNYINYPLRFGQVSRFAFSRVEFARYMSKCQTSEMTKDVSTEAS